ncbi:HNH endonuclease [Alkalinema sp. FACHB-956]|uniref:HNH endonuclease n=1 Tax=Alkalinema sp. FACHB-956 TaxID=2692768 RepID=UPI001688AE18|nr:HNH endonuclease [Alkalinema sp. FACHB-956]MBD2327586.1 HNH endonuclease [Alkalinema sp. FACHB-956]
MMSLETQLHEEMLAMYYNVGREIGYWAHRYLQRVRKVGGLQAAKDWLKPTSSPTRGLQRLAAVNRLDLSLEVFVLQEPWSSLFTKEELQVARQRINLISGGQLAEEVSTASDSNLLEGAVHKVTINAYERNPEARRRCLEKHGYSCFACKFNFKDYYGETAEGFIHVHHIIPLSEIKQEYTVDPINDLCPVCANCHAVIHLGGVTRTIEEVKAMIKANLEKRQSKIISEVSQGSDSI